MCLLFTVSCVFARPAAADGGAALDEHIRRATIDTVQRVLDTLDRDAALSERLTGTWEGGVFVDTRAEVELDTGHLRSAEATLRLTFDTAPERHLAPRPRFCPSLA